MERSRPWILVSLAVVCFIAVTVTAYYKQNGLRDLRKLQSSIAKVEREIAEIRRENERNRMELYSLRQGDEYVEAVARESLGLVKPNEVVYEFVDAGKLK
ncbi:MAG: FtsB family cell division protein [Candidatus Nitrospinota bacterium M3_3B_026]